MRILSINGSPRGAAGNTDMLTRAFLEGAAREEDTVEMVYLKEKKIEHCNGCFTCWFRTPGICAHKDDMVGLLEKIRHADVLLFASPLYVFSVTGLMKDFTDRLIPMAQPYIDLKDGVSYHPSRYPDYNLKAAVLLSTSGFPEQCHFSGMKESFRRAFSGNNPGMRNMICCAGGTLLTMPGTTGLFEWYLDAARQAGREVIEKGVISDATQSILDRPLVDDAATYVAKANEHWKEMGIERIVF